jgi:hypothetical protein
MRALFYLHLTSLRNSAAARLRRLRHPRYLVGFLLGAAYFYFFIIRNTVRGMGRGIPLRLSSPIPEADPSQWSSFIEPLLAAALLGIVVLKWIIPQNRLALQFTEAEIAFLFPAPLSRSTLIHYRLIRSQLGIMVTSVLLGFLSQRWSFLGGTAWTHAAGWWLIFSTLNLHFLAASFTQERLLGLGLTPLKRSLLATALALLLGLGCSVWFLHALPPQPESTTLPLLVSYVHGVIQTPPLGWLLVPFKLLVRPFLASEPGQFLQTFLPGLALLLLHYLWVIRSQVSFEEASLARAQSQAERVAAARNGKSAPFTGKVRTQPFALHAGLPAPAAFLWRGLLEAGPFFHPRTLALLGLALWIALFAAARFHATASLSPVAGTLSLSFAAWLLFFGPMLVRRGTGPMLERIDFVKAFPVRGWQVVSGEMLTPLYLLTTCEWILLGCVAISFAPSQGTTELLRVLAGPGSWGLALLAPPLLGLMLCIPFAAALYFPAWLGSMAGGQRGVGGVEVVGQRILFSFAYAATLLVAVLPAALLGAIPFLVVKLLTQSLTAAVLVASAAAAVLLAAEFALALWWLGRRYEHFDLSEELPR